MTADDLKKIFLSPTLFRLDTILSPRLVPILYATGLAALLLWAVAHLFVTFGRTFGDGLWGLLEIAVYGLFGLVALRIVCEVLLVFFKAHESAARTVSVSRLSNSLLDEVKDAISDIADDAGDPDLDDPEEPPTTTAAASPSTALDVPQRLPPKRPVKRTARRTPPAKPKS